MDKNNNPCKVITGKCRLSYEHVFEAASINGSDPKYSACIVIPKTDKATLAKIQAAVNAAIQDGIKSKWKGKKPVNLKLPLRDGDAERPDDEAFSGCYFLNANANRAPGIVDLARNPILDREEVYSGCYCRFSVNFYPFSASGNNGVAVGLNNVQKVADGERLAGGSRAEDDFSDNYTGDLDDIL
nr:MAG TPA: DNA helix destabilizing protein [Caudoviricetes sp.]